MLTPLARGSYTAIFSWMPLLIRDFQIEIPRMSWLAYQDTQNITGKLKGFARSILSRHQHAASALSQGGAVGFFAS